MKRTQIDIPQHEMHAGICTRNLIKHNMWQTMYIITFFCLVYLQEQQKIEIVEGYGVYCTKLQLENAVTSATNPTKLIRNLLGIFFSKDELAESTALGTRGSRKALDQTVLPACMRKSLQNSFTIKMLAT